MLREKSILRLYAIEFKIIWEQKSKYKMTLTNQFLSLGYIVGIFCRLHVFISTPYLAPRTLVFYLFFCFVFFYKEMFEKWQRI